MALTRLGSAISLAQFNERFAQAVLSDGRVAVAGPGFPGSSGQGVVIYSASGEFLQNVSVGVINGQAGLGSINDIVALANGGFVVSGARQPVDGQPFSGGFAVFDAGGTAQALPGPQGQVRYTRAVFDSLQYDGIFQTMNLMERLPDGRFVMVWTSAADQIAQGSTGVGINNDGRPIFFGGSGGMSTGTDIRARYFNPDGTPSGPELLVTQGIVDLPTYDVYSRFGDQRLYDLDVLPDGKIVVSYMGTRFSMPVDSGGTLFTNPYSYAAMRVLAPINDGTSNTILVGETPFTDAVIGAGTDGNRAVGSSVLLSNGQIASFFGDNANPGGLYDVKMQLMTAGGAKVGAPVSLGLQAPNNNGKPHTFAFQPTADDGFLVLYYADFTATPSFSWNIAVTHYNTLGVAQSTVRLTNGLANHQLRSFEQGPDGSYLATWYTLGANTLTTQRFVYHTGTGLVQTGDDTSNTIQLSESIDWYDGEAGNDVIFGRGGNDRLYGDAGDDFIDGGPGADTMDGGSGFDTVSWSSSATPVTVNLTNQALNAGGALGDVVRDFEVYYLTAGSDRFTNDGRGGYIYGFAGNDTIIGGTGSEFIEGGPGADSIDGGAGFDYLSYVNAAAAVTVNLANPSQNTGEAAGDVIANIEAFFLSAHNDRFVGANGQNIVFGGAGNDTMIGGALSSNWFFGEAGNDRLQGGGFDDLLVGGAGADRFVFQSWVGNGVDTLLDFNRAEGDRIEFGAAGFGLASGHVFTAGVDFIAGASPFAAEARGTVLHVNSGPFAGFLYYDPDGTGSIAPIWIAALPGAAALQASDILVV